MPPRGKRRQLALEAPATAGHVGVLRRAVRGWLAEVVDDDAVDDLTLAVSEALENAADHGFTGRSQPGTMSVTANVDDHGLCIVVSDDGWWRGPRSERHHRGRGLALMGQLTDVSTVRTGTGGTSVTLYRHADPQRSAAG